MKENELFKKCIFSKDKCISYGFKEYNNELIYKKYLLNNTFQAIVNINNNKVKVKIIDIETNEEYINYRIENNIGEFVNTIREEINKLLEDIKNNCTKDNNFIYKQSNRISNYIKEKYNTNPVFPWNDENAVFKNNDTNKWFGIIMYINKNKLTKEDKKIEVMNVKLPPELIDELVTKEGYYRAYHMNKKYWITFTLEDIIDDNELEKLIDISYQYTVRR